MKTPKFDGKLKWVCPHCGAENETVAEECTAYHSFEIDEEGVTPLKLKDLDYNSPLECPSCYEEVTAEDIRTGFRRWLENLKRTDPERHAEILAELLQTT
jgi:hypothetical protein